ncbi:MAG TPA: alcohol dehydrogenase catalytic domain-containing protein [Actinophytocola sp.]|uniref:zinc-dependent alcohol dehydrogenase n=1 Tax=Actinophytocola sp. TaxID=1872138 RepID=UPI002DB76DD3|nr:alcohol dehydrogenase catalytic domain-containing protein [Actinophytocola sp.]HEU5472247.1 alcohol dehydrogenase catalytic domain-containing protein [Actinophytocola sp.]
MREIWIDEPGRIRVAGAEPRTPGPGGALVRVAYAGICGSDREVLAGSRPAAFVRYPVVPGHEWSGTVEAVGDGTDPGLVGKPVVGENIRACGRCPACRRGDGNLCSADYDETGFTRPGAWADQLIVPAGALHVLPADSDLRAAAVLEPAACVASACGKLSPAPGERAAVVGAGTLGLLATQLLAAHHPAELVVIDPRADRAELARRCGATAVHADAPATGGFDLVVEAAGVTGTARTAVRLVRRGGRIALIGIPGADDDPPTPAELVLGEITVHTVFGAPTRAWAAAVRAFAAGALDPAVLITHEVGLADVTEAFRLLADPDSGAVKILLRP